ncbi:LysR family transcriptional regulator [Trebonia sp.]|uniref:LysR family transcriptional regulator n=1 Tax=Trebonia sp. TaxID=2767075 RepID=UPI002603AEDA|nr:LysR family transcriptional regulator [Trebonia sp.]
MELIDLKFFACVAEHLHFGRAAEELVCTTSHVSHRIRRLERQLGVQLFERTTRQVRLTPRGRLLLGETQAILAGIEGMRRIAAEPEGLPGLDLAYSPASAGLITRCLGKLPEFAPQARVRLDPQSTSMEVLRAVTGNQYPIGATQWITRDVDSVQIGVNRLALFVRDDHRLACRSTVTAEDLDGERLIIVAPEVNAGINSEVQKFFVSRQIFPRFESRRITNPENYLDLVAAGQGVAITLASLAQRPGIRKLQIIGPTPAISNVYLVWRHARRPQLVDVLVHAAEEVLTETEMPALAG